MFAERPLPAAVLASLRGRAAHEAPRSSILGTPTGARRGRDGKRSALARARFQAPRYLPRRGGASRGVGSPRAGRAQRSRRARRDPGGDPARSNDAAARSDAALDAADGSPGDGSGTERASPAGGSDAAARLPDGAVPAAANDAPVCDACPACDDACDVPGCATCRDADGDDAKGALATTEGGGGGGWVGRRVVGGSGDASSSGMGPSRVDFAERGLASNIRRVAVTAEMAAEAARAARLAAANPHRDGWGHRDGGPLGDDDASASRPRRHRFTCCQVARRRRGGDLWLVAGGEVFDATLFMNDHPVGPLPMLRGKWRDNTEDMEMHSAAARRAWRKLRVGTLRRCPKRGFGEFKPPRSRPSPGAR